MGNPEETPEGAGTEEVRYDDPLKDPNYKVVHHDLPPEDDLRAHLHLLKSFERRLMHTAEAGGQWVKAHKKEDVERVVRTRTAAFEDARDEQHKALHGNILCTALLERGLDAAKQHIKKRLKGADPESPELKELAEQASHDLQAAMPLRQYLRRKNGHPDRDDVVGEMIGEPYKIFVGTLPGNHRVLEAFQNLRALKEARAMKCIDRIIDAAVQVAQAQPEFLDAAVDKKLENLRNWSKKRVSVQVGDKDFEKVHEQTLIARNMIQDYVPESMQKKDEAEPPSSLPADHRLRFRKPSVNSLVLLREAADIVFDMTHIRGERKESAAFYEARVQEELSRLAGVGGPAGGRWAV